MGARGIRDCKEEVAGGGGPSNTSGEVVERGISAMSSVEEYSSVDTSEENGSR